MGVRQTGRGICSKQYSSLHRGGTMAWCRHCTQMDLQRSIMRSTGYCLHTCQQNAETAVQRKTPQKGTCWQCMPIVEAHCNKPD